jgi:hypothetical protein
LLGGNSRSAMSNVWSHVAFQPQPIGYLTSFDVRCEYSADCPASVFMIAINQQTTGLDCCAGEILQSLSISLGLWCNSAGGTGVYDPCFRVGGSSCTSAHAFTIRGMIYPQCSNLVTTTQWIVDCHVIYSRRRFVNTPLCRCVRRIFTTLSVHIHGSRWRARIAPPQRCGGGSIEVISSISSRLRFLSSSLHNTCSPHSLVSFLVCRNGIP